MAADYLAAVDMSAWYMTVPVLTFILGAILQVETWRWFRFLILLLGTVGAVLLALGIQEQPLAAGTLSFSFGKVEQIFLIGCLMMAFYPVLSKRYIQKKHIMASPLLSSFWSLLIGGIRWVLLQLSAIMHSGAYCLTMPVWQITFGFYIRALLAVR